VLTSGVFERGRRSGPDRPEVPPVLFSSDHRYLSSMVEPADRETNAAEDPIVTCDCQGGTLSVYEDRVIINRSKRSMHDDKTIPMDEIDGIEYSSGITTGHIQVQQVGMDNDEPGWFSHPVDENTLYFPWGGRDCAKRARDAILERASGRPG